MGLLIAALLTASAAEPDPCLTALHQQAAHDFHCGPDDVFAWADEQTPPGEAELFGCGYRAVYRLASSTDEGCHWEAKHAPRLDPEQAKNALRFNLGAGAPTGIVGVSYERRFGSLFAVEPGAGWGVSGFQASLMVRLRNFPLLGDPGFGASLAFGPQPSWLVGQKRNVIVWLNAEVLAQAFRFESGLELSVGAGAVVPVYGEFSVCRGSCTPVQSQAFLYPALRLGLGWWLR